MSNPYGGLKERVANAKGADRTLFEDVAMALFPRGAPKDFRNRWRTLLDAEAWESAALALVEAKLPGWAVQMEAWPPSTGKPDRYVRADTERHPASARAKLTECGPDGWHSRGDGHRIADGSAPTPALALLSALLEALDTGDDHE